PEMDTCACKPCPHSRRNKKTNHVFMGSGEIDYSIIWFVSHKPSGITKMIQISLLLLLLSLHQRWRWADPVSVKKWHICASKVHERNRVKQEREDFADRLTIVRQ